MVAVGSPGGFNYAFDAIRCKPDYAWYGGFLDFSGEANGRGGKGGKILGVKRPLGLDDTPLRIGNPDAAPESIRFHGYRRNPNTGDPTFLYEVDGTVVEQTVTAGDGESLALGFKFDASNGKKRYYRIDTSIHQRVTLSDGLRWVSPKVVEIPASVTVAAIAIDLKPSAKTFVRASVEMNGEILYQNYCMSCHSTDGGNLIGPTFKGLWEREQTVTREGESQTIVVDEAYLRESVEQPQAAIVQGYEQVPMANFSSVMNDAQLDALIEFLKTIE